MPIDTSIYNNLQPATIANPMDIFLRVQNAKALNEQRMALAQERQQRADVFQQQQQDIAARDAAVAGGGSTEDIIGRLPGHLQAGARESYAKADTAAAAWQKAQMEAGTAQAEYLGSVAAGLKPYIAQAGNDPQALLATVKLGLDHVAQQGDQGKQLAAQLWQHFQQNPGDIGPTIDQAIQGSKTQRELLQKENAGFTLGPNQTRYEPGKAPVTAPAAPPQPISPYQQAQLNIERAKLGETLRHNKAVEGDGINADSPDAAAAADVMGRFMAQTGRMPVGFRVYGKDSAKFYTQVAAKADEYAKASGTDLGTAAASFTANQTSLNTQQKFYDSAQAFLATADKNSELLEATLKKIPDIKSPVLNKPLRALANRVQGDPNMAQFATYLTSVQNEYAKILTNPNLAGQLTDSARKETQTLVSEDSTVPQILASLRALRAEGGNRLGSIGSQISTIQGRIKGGSPTAQPMGTSAAPAAGTIYAKDPQGNIHAAKAGTALPAGWTQVKGPGG